MIRMSYMAPRFWAIGSMSARPCYLPHAANVKHKRQDAPAGAGELPIGFAMCMMHGEPRFNSRDVAGDVVIREI